MEEQHKKLIKIYRRLENGDSNCIIISDVNPIITRYMITNFIINNSKNISEKNKQQFKEKINLHTNVTLFNEFNEANMFYTKALNGYNIAITNLSNAKFYDLISINNTNNAEEKQKILNIKKGEFDYAKSVLNEKSNNLNNEKTEILIQNDELQAIDLKIRMEATDIFKIEITNNVLEIQDNSFRNLRQLSEVILPHDALFTNISDNTFCGCKSLKKLILPPSVISIGNNAFKQTGFSAVKTISQLGWIMLRGITDEYNDLAKKLNMPMFKYNPIQNDLDIHTWNSEYQKHIDSQYIVTDIDISEEQNNLSLYAEIVQNKELVHLDILHSIKCLEQQLSRANQDSQTEIETVINDLLDLARINEKKARGGVDKANAELRIRINKNVTPIKESWILANIMINDIDTNYDETWTKQEYLNSNILLIYDTVNTIGNSAFSDCTLVSADLNGIKNIGNGLFKNNKILFESKLNDTLITIPKELFKNCYNFRNFIPPKDIETINDEVFSGCFSLNKLILPPTVKNIGDRVFKQTGFSSVMSLSISDWYILTNDIHSYRRIDSNIDQEKFNMMVIYYRSNFVSISIDASVNQLISNDTLKNVINKIINAKNKIDSYIGEQEEQGKFNYIIPPLISEPFNVANNEFDLLTKEINNENIIKEKWLLFENNHLNSNILIIYDTVVTVGNGVFSDCSLLTSADLNGIKNIGNGLFKNNKILLECKLNNDLTSIPEELFKNCCNLRNFTPPPSLVTINNETFSGCLSLNKLILPTTVTCIGTGAFQQTGFSLVSHQEIFKFEDKIPFNIFKYLNNDKYILESNSISYIKNLSKSHDDKSLMNVFSILDLFYNNERKGYLTERQLQQSILSMSINITSLANEVRYKIVTENNEDVPLGAIPSYIFSNILDSVSIPLPNPNGFPIVDLICWWLKKDGVGDSILTVKQQEDLKNKIINHAMERIDFSGVEPAKEQYDMNTQQIVLKLGTGNIIYRLDGANILLDINQPKPDNLHESDMWKLQISGRLKNEEQLEKLKLYIFNKIKKSYITQNVISKAVGDKKLNSDDLVVLFKNFISSISYTNVGEYIGDFTIDGLQGSNLEHVVQDWFLNNRPVDKLNNIIDLIIKFAVNSIDYSDVKHQEAYPMYIYEPLSGSTNINQSVVVGSEKVVYKIDENNIELDVRCVAELGNINRLSEDGLDLLKAYIRRLITEEVESKFNNFEKKIIFYDDNNNLRQTNELEKIISLIIDSDLARRGILGVDAKRLAEKLHEEKNNLLKKGINPFFEKTLPTYSTIKSNLKIKIKENLRNIINNYTFTEEGIIEEQIRNELNEDELNTLILNIISCDFELLNVKHNWFNPVYNITVNNRSNKYYVNNVEDDTIILYRGDNYHFKLNHNNIVYPFAIQTVNNTYDKESEYTDGIIYDVNYNTFQFRVPFNAPDKLYYVCKLHAGMGKKIEIKDRTFHIYVNPALNAFKYSTHEDKIKTIQLLKNNIPHKDIFSSHINDEIIFDIIKNNYDNFYRITSVNEFFKKLNSNIIDKAMNGLNIGVTYEKLENGGGKKIITYKCKQNKTIDAVFTDNFDMNPSLTNYGLNTLRSYIKSDIIALLDFNGIEGPVNYLCENGNLNICDSNTEKLINIINTKLGLLEDSDYIEIFNNWTPSGTFFDYELLKCIIAEKVVYNIDNNNISYGIFDYGYKNSINLYSIGSFSLKEYIKHKIILSFDTSDIITPFTYLDSNNELNVENPYVKKLIIKASQMGKLIGGVTVTKQMFLECTQISSEENNKLILDDGMVDILIHLISEQAIIDLEENGDFCETHILNKVEYKINDIHQAIILISQNNIEVKNNLTVDGINLIKKHIGNGELSLNNMKFDVLLNNTGIKVKYTINEPKELYVFNNLDKLKEYVKTDIRGCLKDWWLTDNVAMPINYLDEDGNLNNAEERVKALIDISKEVGNKDFGTIVTKDMFDQIDIDTAVLSKEDLKSLIISIILRSNINVDKILGEININIDNNVIQLYNSWGLLFKNGYSPYGTHRNLPSPNLLTDTKEMIAKENVIYAKFKKSIAEDEAIQTHNYLDKLQLDNETPPEQLQEAVTNVIIKLDNIQSANHDLYKEENKLNDIVNYRVKIVTMFNNIFKIISEYAPWLDECKIYNSIMSKLFIDNNFSVYSLKNEISLFSLIHGLFFNIDISNINNIDVSLTKLKEGAFEKCKKLKQVNLDYFTRCNVNTNEYQEILKKTFKNCTSLKIVKLPYKLTSFKESAFSGCVALSELNLSNLGFKNRERIWSNNILSIQYSSINYGYYDLQLNFGTESFKDCIKLNNILSGIKTIDYCVKNYILGPGTGKYIEMQLGERSFMNTGFTDTITLFGSMETIVTRATNLHKGIFQGCSKLTTFNSPYNCENIMRESFKDCSKLTYVTLPVNEYYNEISEAIFMGCSSLECIEIPNTVTAIKHSAFRGSKIKKITLPNKLTTIESLAFALCNNLVSFMIPESVTTLGHGILERSESIEELVYVCKNVPLKGTEEVIDFYPYDEVRSYSHDEVDTVSNLQVESTKKYYSGTLFGNVGHFSRGVTLWLPEFPVELKHSVEAFSGMYIRSVGFDYEKLCLTFSGEEKFVLRIKRDKEGRMIDKNNNLLEPYNLKSSKDGTLLYEQDHTAFEIVQNNYIYDGKNFIWNEEGALSYTNVKNKKIIKMEQLLPSVAKTLIAEQAIKLMETNGDFDNVKLCKEERSGIVKYTINGAFTELNINNDIDFSIFIQNYQHIIENIDKTTDSALNVLKLFIKDKMKKSISWTTTLFKSRYLNKQGKINMQHKDIKMLLSKGSKLGDSDGNIVIGITEEILSNAFSEHVVYPTLELIKTDKITLYNSEPFMEEFGWHGYWSSLQKPLNGFDTDKGEYVLVTDGKTTEIKNPNNDLYNKIDNNELLVGFLGGSIVPTNDILKIDVYKQDQPCFIAGTIITTDQGPVPIEKLTKDNSIRGIFVSRVTECYSTKCPLVLIKKDAFGTNRPDKDTISTIWHRVYVNENDKTGKRFKKLVNEKTVKILEKQVQLVYNVQLGNVYTYMHANNLKVETLKPTNNGRTIIL